MLEFVFPQMTLTKRQSFDKSNSFKIMSVKIRLLADGLMILKVLFLKTLTLLHLLTFISRLFYNDLWIDGAFKKP